MTTPKLDEDFLKFESKVNQIVKLLDDMSMSSKGEGEATRTSKPLKIEGADLDDFIVSFREDCKGEKKAPKLQKCKTEDESDSEEDDLSEDEVDLLEREQEKEKTIINKKPPKQTCPEEMDKFTFMRQLEEDANERAKVRREREEIAQRFRSLGNKAYRSGEYEKAILMYTKAIEHVKDSPILYNNRALAFIKLKNFRRGQIDCDYVLNKLDERNVRSWMYRAAACKRLLEDYNYKDSIAMAKKHNSKLHDFIDDFVRKIETGLF